MAFVELCRLHGNGRGGWEGIVDGEKRGDGWMVPGGTKFTLWTLGSENVGAFLLEAVQPRDVGGQDREWEGAHLLCKIWKRKIKQGYFGKTKSTENRELNWEWDLPTGLVFNVFDDRPGNRGFVVKIDSVGVRKSRS